MNWKLSYIENHVVVEKVIDGTDASLQDVLDVLPRRVRGVTLEPLGELNPWPANFDSPQKHPHPADRRGDGEYDEPNEPYPGAWV